MHNRKLPLWVLAVIVWVPYRVVELLSRKRYDPKNKPIHREYINLKKGDHNDG